IEELLSPDLDRMKQEEQAARNGLRLRDPAGRGARRAHVNCAAWLVLSGGVDPAALDSRIRGNDDNSSDRAVRGDDMTGDAKGEYRGLAYRNDAELTAWLAKRPREAALEPDLPIIDPHHHLWDTPQRGRYLLPELLADIGGGHNIVATVFLECRSMYKKDGPAEMAPVGEVEFVNGIAAMSASGGYGPCRV